MKSTLVLSGVALNCMIAVLAMPGVVAAQTAPRSGTPQATPTPISPGTGTEGVDESEDIVVTGRPLPGAVIGDIPPEEQLSPADIRSYGVSSVGDLLTALAPQTGSGRGSGGRPVVLLDGRRISGFREIRDLPAEAILRVDILPEEVALKYGYRADQKVVNFVLRPRFRAATVEAEDKFATGGGRNNPQGELDLLSIRNGQRLNLHLEYQQSDALTEAERDIRFTPSPFSIPGNVTGAGGGEIDPVFSALAGSTVTIASIPAGPRATLGAYLPGAGIASVTDPTPYRTLLPTEHSFTANAVYARKIFGDVQASFNATIETTDSQAQFGLPTVALGVPAGNPFSPFTQGVVVDRTLSDGFKPLTQDNSIITAHLGSTFNGTIGTWQWSLTGIYDRIDSKTLTSTGFDTVPLQARINAGDPGLDPFAPFPPALFGVTPADIARSKSSSGNVDALFTGTLFGLPAGDVATSIRIGGETNDFTSRSLRGGIAQSGDVPRDIVNGQINLDLPIASRSRNVLSPLGQLSANFNYALDHLSDFGTLKTLGYGINWAPVEAVRLIASVTDQDEAPSAQQLGNPVITTPNVRVFDYVNGTTATVTRLSGGNTALIADNSHVTKIGLTIKPFDKPDLTIISTYVSERVRDPIAAFPTPTAIIEAAFPGRFSRDASGQLFRIDQRPINFARSDRQQLRTGFNLSIPIKSKIQREIEAFRAGTGPDPFAGLRPPGGGRRGGDAPAGGDAAAPAGTQPKGGTPPNDGAAPAADRSNTGDGGRRGGGFGGGRFGGRGGGGRLQFALYDTWFLKQQVLVADGGPLLDLLNGDAIGQSGGQSRHQIEAQAGYTNNGIGIRFSADYQTGTSVNGGTPGAPARLDFGGLATANFRVFANLGQRLDLVRKHPWLRGARLLLAVDNIFNGRQRVTDENGETPIGFQPAYLDPLGRTVRLSIRKQFF